MKRIVKLFFQTYTMEVELNPDKPLFKIAINSDGANDILTLIFNEITRQGNEIEEIKRQLGAIKGEDGILALRDKLNAQASIIDKQVQEITNSGIEQQGRIKQLFTEMEKKTEKLIEESQAQVRRDVQSLKESNEKVARIWGGEGNGIAMGGKLLTPGEALAEMQKCMEEVSNKTKIFGDTTAVLETLRQENDGKTIADVISDMCTAAKQRNAEREEAVVFKEQIAQLKQQMEKQEQILDQTGLSNMSDVPDFSRVTALAEALRGEGDGDPAKAFESIVKKAMEEVAKENPHLVTGKETAAILQKIQNELADGLNKMENIEERVESCATKGDVFNVFQEISGADNPDGTAISQIKCRCLACGRPKINLTMKTDATLLGILGYQPLPQTPREPKSSARVTTMADMTPRPGTEGLAKTARRTPADERATMTPRMPNQTPTRERSLSSKPRYPGTATSARAPLSKPK